MGDFKKWAFYNNEPTMEYNRQTISYRNTVKVLEGFLIDSILSCNGFLFKGVAVYISTLLS